MSMAYNVIRREITDRSGSGLALRRRRRRRRYSVKFDPLRDQATLIFTNFSPRETRAMHGGTAQKLGM